MFLCLGLKPRLTLLQDVVVFWGGNGLGQPGGSLSVNFKWTKVVEQGGETVAGHPTVLEGLGSFLVLSTIISHELR